MNCHYCNALGYRNTHGLPEDPARALLWLQFAELVGEEVELEECEFCDEHVEHECPDCMREYLSR